MKINKSMEKNENIGRIGYHLKGNKKEIVLNKLSSQVMKQ